MTTAHSINAAKFSYRPDIDGLRAVSVIGVVLYHYGVSVPGGFVGVDVFFVISGFLITRMIRAQIEAGSFSLVDFYEARTRRIIPALLLMLAFVTVMCVATYLPADLRHFGASLRGAVAFVSNFVFWREGNYFGAESGTKPLLHTWSLGVEEQFYLAFPLMLMLLRPTRPFVVVAAISIIGLLSLAFSEWSLQSHARASFYLSPSRVWELMLGALTALALSSEKVRSWAAKAPLLGVLGLSTILLAMAIYSPASAFPGLYALLPCMGAVFVLLGNRNGHSISARMLGCPPLVGLGLISYSLYLWHWPLLVLVNYNQMEPIGWVGKTILVVLSMGFALASWHWVEKPVRMRRRLKSRRQLFGWTAAAAGILFAIGLVPLLTGGLPQRFSQEVRGVLTAGVVMSNTCPSGREGVVQYRVCRIGSLIREPDFFVWGDSHAAAMADAFDIAGQHKGRAGEINAWFGCPPLLGIHRQGTPSCRAELEASLARASAPHVKDVFLVARWAAYAEGKTDMDGQNDLSLKDIAHPHGPRENQAVFSRGLERTVAALHRAGKRVIIVEGVPESPVNVTAATAKQTVGSGRSDLSVSALAYRKRQETVSGTVGRLAARYPLRRFSPANTLCDKDRCALTRNGLPLYSDTNHLNAKGAEVLAPALGRVL